MTCHDPSEVNNSSCKGFHNRLEIVVGVLILQWIVVFTRIDVSPVDFVEIDACFLDNVLHLDQRENGVSSGVRIFHGLYQQVHLLQVLVNFNSDSTFIKDRTMKSV